MTPTTPTHGPESDDGRQDAPGATDAATGAREAIDLDAIEARAQAATPGPWRADVLGSEGYAVTGPQGSGSGHRLRVPRVARCGHEDWDTDRVNAEHIAGMDPATTLALVRELREARAEVERLRGACTCGQFSPDAYEGPDETCPSHGRPYGEWVRRGDLLQRRVDDAAARLAHAEATAAGWAEKSDREVARAEAAEAERDDLRAQLAKVEALRERWEAEADANLDEFPKQARTMESAARELGEVICDGCCGSCGGLGAGGPASGPETNGLCGDCYGTGHQHDIPAALRGDR